MNDAVDNLAALSARDDLLWIVAHWDDLRARLRPGGGNALTGMPSGGGDVPAPIDVGISDMLHEIEENVARFYAHILMDETDWEPTTSAMPQLLTEVTQRYGHFTTDDDPMMALGFCDDAHEWRHKVERALERPAPPTYLGPCPGENCAGEIHMREHRTSATCPECGREVGMLEQRAFLDRELDARLMTLAELPRALSLLGVKVPAGTVRRWASQALGGPPPKLRPAVPGEELYRLADAKALAESGRRKKVAA